MLTVMDLLSHYSYPCKNIEEMYKMISKFDRKAEAATSCVKANQLLMFARKDTGKKQLPFQVYCLSGSDTL